MEEREETIKEQRRALVAELRSGRREQAQGRLAKTDGGFCCLGVACEVAIAQGVPLYKVVQLDGDGTPAGFFRYHTRGDRGSASTLPDAAAEWFGFEEVPQLLIPAELVTDDMWIHGRLLREVWQADRKFSAIALNDELLFTLPQIADCFELTFLPEDWEARRGEVTSG